MAKRTCSIDDCGRPVFARGWCNRHYNRWRSHGDPLTTLRRPPVDRPRIDPAVRFWPKVEKTETCWLWTGALFKTSGYGQFSCQSTNMLAHIWSYENVNGPVPDGLQLDHLCRVRRCVNPAHLEAVTAQVNNLRSEAPSARNAMKTHCPQGHPYAGTNLYTYRGQRVCRECGRLAQRRYNERKRARKGAA